MPYGVKSLDHNQVDTTIYESITGKEDTRRKKRIYHARQHSKILCLSCLLPYPADQFTRNQTCPSCKEHFHSIKPKEKM